MYQHYAQLASAFVYVVMVFPVFIALFFTAWTVLIVIYCDFLCYWVYRPQGCIKLDLTSPTKLCSLDPMPTLLLHEYTDLLWPYVTKIVNASLTQGRLPVSQRHAIVMPLLKKPGLDATDKSNYELFVVYMTYVTYVMGYTTRNSRVYLIKL